MTKVRPFHAGDEPEKSKREEVYHTHNDCPAAQKITTGRVPGNSGYRLCKFCKKMH